MGANVRSTYAPRVQQRKLLVQALMFPEADELSNIISDTIKVVFKRRLVDRVLRLWTEIGTRTGISAPRPNRALKAGRRLEKLPRDRRAVACTAFIFGRRWGELIVYALPRG